MHPRTVIIGLWILWAISWVIAAAWAADTQKQSEDFGPQAVYRSLLVIGGALLAFPVHPDHWALRLWHVGWSGAWTCAALEALGFAFAWWARVHLGKLWSGRITRKTDHRVIDTGPYAIVRHPIYTGILLAFYATAGAKATLFGLAGAAVMTAGFWYKARLEERWLAQELGAPYQEYRRRVPMLLPFGPKAQ
jgi:protein-S-isoprenylcysteine O-methyltransferase Ste14